MADILSMSKRELTRTEIMQRLLDHRLKQAQAASMLAISVRHLKRLLRAYRTDGAAALISKRRGRPGNHRLPQNLTDQALELIRAKYADFGPTLAHEKLTELHHLKLSVESLRQLMIAAGLWQPRRGKAPRIHQSRARRSCLGELCQIDGSPHDWFEGRARRCTLLVFIDDATSRLMQLRFVESETTFSYFEATGQYLRRHGKPRAFYSDKYAVFRPTKAEALSGQGLTQFGRAMQELGIEIICANTPQAKGRVERANKTLQDRLVKELRLQGISTIAAGNQLLPGFLADYNARFGKEPHNPKNLHRPLSADDDLADVFAWREERTISNNLTLQYDKVVFLIEPNEFTRELRRKRVTVVDYPDGRLAIRYRGLDLPYTTFDKLRQVSQATIVENKHLGAVLSHIREQQIERAEARSQSAPRRQGQVGHMFKVG